MEGAFLLRVALASRALRTESDCDAVDSQGNAQQAGSLGLERNEVNIRKTNKDFTYNNGVRELELLEARKRETELGTVDMDFGLLGL